MPRQHRHEEPGGELRNAGELLPELHRAERRMGAGRDLRRWRRLGHWRGEAAGVHADDRGRDGGKDRPDPRKEHFPFFAQRGRLSGLCPAAALQGRRGALRERTAQHAGRILRDDLLHDGRHRSGREPLHLAEHPLGLRETIRSGNSPYGKPARAGLRRSERRADAQRGCVDRQNGV